MIAASQRPMLTPEEYLTLEEASEIRHEYVEGEIYAMSGGTDAHSTISLNCAAILRAHGRGSGCRTFGPDMKAHLERLQVYYYPDVQVTCEPRDQQNIQFKQYARLIVEVLSKSTEAFDRGQKFENYQTLDSLQEYVLIDQYRPRVDCFRRTETGLWLLQGYGPGERVQFKTVGWEGAIEDLYEDVIFQSPMSEVSVTDV